MITIRSIALINNIEEDHLDYYSSLDDIIDAFKGFALQEFLLQNDGGIITHRSRWRTP